MVGLKPSNKEPAKQYETVAVRKDQYEALCANYAAALAEIKRLTSARDDYLLSALTDGGRNGL